MSKIDHFQAHFLPYFGSKSWSYKRKLKFLLRNHLFQFLNEKSFSGHSFGAKFELKFD